MKLVKRIVKWTVAVILLVLVGWLFIAYWTSTNDCNRNAATPTNPMKAIVNCEYGIGNLQVRELEKPSPNDNEVFGAKNGAAADYICVKADRGIVTKPGNVTFEQAGSVAIAGLTALQGLR